MSGKAESAVYRQRVGCSGMLTMVIRCGKVERVQATTHWLEELPLPPDSDSMGVGDTGTDSTGEVVKKVWMVAKKESICEK